MMVELKVVRLVGLRVALKGQMMVGPMAVPWAV